MEIIVQAKDINKRIDIFLMEQEGLSRSKVQRMIETKMVLVNHHEIKSSYKIKEGDIITSEEYIEEDMNIEIKKMVW